MQTQEELESRLNELTNQRDSATEQVKNVEAQAETLSEQLKDAIAQTDTLKDQLREKTKEISDYDQWVSELQTTIEGLKLQVEELSEQPAEQFEDEEVNDGNNV